MLSFVSRLLRPTRTVCARRFWSEPLEQRLLLTRLAVIGDYSSNVQTAPTRDVSNLVKSWSPDGVVTAGDNNYPGGAASTIDANIGQWYHQYIYPYTGSYGAGSADGQNHFWPTLGNHDWDPGNVLPYTNYFTLPNNERYYTVQIGNIALFVCDGEPGEPDGTSATSVQGQWIKNAMLNSTATWKLVLYHEPVYSSGLPSNPTMNWPFASWGASAIINGHMHGYERLIENGMTYITDGLGGESIFSFGTPIAGSQVTYDSDYGAMRVDSTNTSLTFTFVTRTGSVIDTYTIGNPVPTPPSNPHAVASPGQIALSWSASGGATSYSVYRGTSPGGEGASPIATNITNTSYTDTNVSAGTTYYYEISASNAAGQSAMSAETSASLAPPSTPSSLVIAGGIGQIALSWGAANGAASYNVYRGTSPGGENATPLATGITGTSFTSTGLSQAATFYYTIKAVNGFGTSSASAEVSATTMSPPSHVVIVVESHYDPSIIDENSTADPYIQSLMDGGALFTLAQGVTYPGQPNYLALFSGSTQGVTDDTPPSSQFTTANLASQLISGGLSFTGYAQGLPSVGSLVASSPPYYRYHNPWSDFSNIPSTDNQPFTSFPSNFASLPTVSFVVPDFNNDMHDGTITQGDTWLQANLGAYATWATTHNSLLILTWDDNVSGTNPNSIATIIYGQPVQPGVFNDPIDHYGVLRTIEDLYGLSHLGSASTAITIQDAWHAVPLGPPAPTSLVATAGGAQQIALSWSPSSGATSYNVYRGTTTGGESPTPIATGVSTTNYNDTSLTPGVTYFYQVTAVNGSGESPRSLESSAATQKVSPTFTALTSPIITYGTATTTISGTIAAGALIPTGNVSITINGANANAAINATTGAFTTNFDTHLIPASPTAYTITFSYAGNTSFNAASDTTQTLTVNKRSLTVSATGVNRVYDGTTSDTVTLSDNRVNSDSLTITYGSALFTDKIVGAAKTVSVSGISVSGAAAGEYTLANTTATTTANITARSLTVTATGTSRIYDGTTSDTVTLADNRIAGDIFTDACTSANFATKTVGTGKTVTVTGISISGTDASNYTANTTTTSTANITVRTLNVTPTGVSRVYDGTTSATVTTTDDRITGDVFTVSDTAAFATKTVGTAKPVNVTGISISGADAPNYTLSSTTGSTSADITARSLTVNATGVNRQYDGTTSDTVTLSDTRISGDLLTDSDTAANFADKNVGSNKTISVSGIAISGADAANYSLSNTTTQTTADITARTLTVTAIGINKTYDATTSATVTLSDNRLTGDVLTDSSLPATFSDKNVGTGKTITVTGINITGVDAGNYTLASTSTTATANITARSLTVSATGVNKNYDATTSAIVTLSDNRISGDALTDSYAAATFADKNVGTAKSISVTGIAITGADSGNYTLSSTSASTTANISARSLTVSATGVSKTYDATTSAAVTLSDNRIPGDTLTDSYTSATFADRNVGTAKSITVTGISITGTDGANYSVTSTTASASADITARTLTVTAIGINKTYDATASATVTLSDNRLPGDVFSDTYTSASFADKNVGTAKPISVTGIAITGADAANYSLTNPTTTASANVTALSITGSFTAQSRTYDANTDATIAIRSLTGVLGSDAVSLTGGAASFDTKNVGTGKTVTATGLTLSGNDATNYTLSNPTETTAADITPLSITGSVTASDKPYDTTTAASLSARNLIGVLASDDVTLTGGTATFDTKDAATGKTVTVTGLSLSGNDSANYTLSNTIETTTAAITPAPLTGTVTIASKPYDATTAATILNQNLAGILASDVVNPSGGSASFDTKNIGAAKTVTITGLTLTGTDAADYSLTNPTETTTADITPELVIPGTTAADTFKLESDANPAFVDWFILNNGNPTAVGQLAASDPAGLTINGAGATDSIQLDYSAGNPLPTTLHLNGTFMINGLSGANPLANTTLEIGQSTLYFAYTPGQSPLTLIRQALAQGYNNGAWTGTPNATTGALISSAIAANPGTAIGYADSATDPTINTTPNSVELKFTLTGDTNLSGSVDIFDLNPLLAHYNKPGSWTGGDFNYDGTVDIFDLNPLLANYNHSLPQLAPASASTTAATQITQPAPIASATSFITPSATITATITPSLNTASPDLFTPTPPPSTPDQPFPKKPKSHSLKILTKPAHEQ